MITGKDDSEHLRTLEEVLSRLEKVGARLKRNKCAFILTSLEYLGHLITAHGLQPTDQKVKALKTASSNRLDAAEVIPGALSSITTSFSQTYLLPFSFVQVTAEEGTMAVETK